MLRLCIALALPLAILASSSPCGSFAYQCPVADSRAIGGCDGCCCEYGFSASSGCSCAPSPTPETSTCGVYSYECDSNGIEGCETCCCNFGYEASSGCECAPVPTPTPTTAGNTCGNFAYQCNSNDTRYLDTCAGCCCNYGFEQVGDTCNCVGTQGTPNPTPSPSSSAGGQCDILTTYVCNPGDDRNVYGNGCVIDTCCCSYGFEQVHGTCGCTQASTPTATPTATQPVCGLFAYECSSQDINAISGCAGCCCEYGYQPTEGCDCATPSKAPTPSGTPTPTPTGCDPLSTYWCGNQDSNYIAACGCCCFFGYTRIGDTCACAPTPTPTAVAAPTCGTNTYQCALDVSTGSNSGCPGCCCFYGTTPDSGSNKIDSCSCSAPEVGTCGVNTFDCGGAGGPSQPALTGGECDQCCCNWGLEQNGACTCGTPSPTPAK